MEGSREIWRQADKDYAKIFGRSYGGLVDPYKCDDADCILWCVGTVATTTRTVVDKLRDEGLKVGLAKLRVLRPVPFEEIRALADKAKFMGVIDRGHTLGYTGALAQEIKNALYAHNKRPPIKDYVIGVGGRDITTKHIERIFRDMVSLKDKGLDKEEQWIDLKTPGGMS
jgi:pyruvate/2-oxoacid:ferredoxin oxidoreductase alpha subunit